MKIVKGLKIEFFFMPLFILFYSASSFAELDCTYNGKKVSIYSYKDRETFDGTVTCEGMLGGSLQKEIYQYKKGHKTQEKIKGKLSNHVYNYVFIKDREEKDGEQLEFYESDRKKREEFYKEGRQFGKQTEYYESGKVKSIVFYSQKSASPDTYDVATINYFENGNLQYLKCSEKKEETIDPKLCGFEGQITVNRLDAQGKVKASMVMLNGKIQSSEAAAAPVEKYYNAAKTHGVLTDPPATKTKRDNLVGGNVQFTDLYENGQVKRKYTLNEKGYIFGEDNEFFISGAKVRTTVFNFDPSAPLMKVTVSSNQCWWENGKKKHEIEATSSRIKTQDWYDNGQLSSSGNFLAEGPMDYSSSLESYITCDEVEFKRDGKQLTFSKDGFPRSECNYKNDKIEGACLLYDEYGKIEEDAFYQNDKLLKKKVYKGGKLVKDEEYYSDGSVKTK
jgi:antitoxin component YwqK of YwqJK toxin-antitoxin module